MMDWEAAWPHIASLLGATALAAIGGELFVRGVEGTAARWRLPQLLVALTVAACATSAPELTVSIMASTAGNSALAMGDALGSNVTNILLILGGALLFGTLPARTEALCWHYYCVAACPVLTLVLVLDGALSRADGALLLGLFLAWLLATILHARRVRPAPSAADEATGKPLAALVFLLVGGVCILAFAGRLFAQGGSALSQLFGLPETAVGATVVALGTSMPELMTTLVARWRGQHDIGLGTLLGSNLFNGLAILGLAALITPVRVAFPTVAIVLLFGLVSILLLRSRNDQLTRRRGILMLAGYAVFVALLSLSGGAH
jgi:cation:H+ antiporter